MTKPDLSYIDYNREFRAITRLLEDLVGPVHDARKTNDALLLIEKHGFILVSKATGRQFPRQP